MLPHNSRYPVPPKAGWSCRMTLVESWGRSVRHDDSQYRDVRRVTRRAALQIGAGAGVAAVASPYVARLSGRTSDGTTRGVDLGGARPIFAPIKDWPVPAIVTARAVGRERRAAQTRSGLRRLDLEVRRAPHGHAERRHELPRVVPRHPRERDRGGVHRRRVQLAHRSERSNLRGPLGAGLPGRRCAHGRAQRCERARGARDLPQLEHDRDRVDGHVRHRRPAARDGERAGHVARVEVRALGRQPDGPRHLSRVERRGREPVQHLRASRYLRDRLPGPARRTDAPRHPGPGREPHHRRGVLGRDEHRPGRRVRWRGR